MQKYIFCIFLCKIAVTFSKVEKDIFKVKRTKKVEKKFNNESMSIPPFLKNLPLPNKTFKI